MANKVATWQSKKVRGAGKIAVMPPVIPTPTSFLLNTGGNDDYDYGEPRTMYVEDGVIVASSYNHEEWVDLGSSNWVRYRGRIDVWRKNGNNWDNSTVFAKDLLAPEEVLSVNIACSNTHIFGYDGVDSIHILKWNGSSYDLEQTIINSDFSSSKLEYHNNHLIVGTNSYDSNAGQVRVYEYNGTNNWNNVFTKNGVRNRSSIYGTHADGLARTISVDKSITNDLVFSASADTYTLIGRVFVFHKNGGSWDEFSVPSPVISSAPFGNATCSIDNQRFIAEKSGIAYVYEWNGSNAYTAVTNFAVTIYPSASLNNIDGKIYSGNISDDTDGFSNNGTMKIYGWNGSTYVLDSTFKHPIPADGQYFGDGLVRYKNTIIVSARGLKEIYVYENY